GAGGMPGNRGKSLFQGTKLCYTDILERTGRGNTKCSRQIHPGRPAEMAAGGRKSLYNMMETGLMPVSLKRRLQILKGTSKSSICSLLVCTAVKAASFRHFLQVQTLGSTER